MSKSNQSPSDLARETFKTLASRKTPPTPANYAKIYSEISGEASEEDGGAEKVLRGIADRIENTPKFTSVSSALRRVIGSGDWEQCLKEIEKVLPKMGGSDAVQSWADLIRDLLRQLETTHKGLTVSRKKEALENVLSRFAANPEALFEKLSGLIKSWKEQVVAIGAIEMEPAAPATISAISPSSIPGSNAEMLDRLSELLAQALESILSTLPDLSQHVQNLASQVRSSKTPELFAVVEKQLRQFWIKVELHAGDNAKIHDGLVRLLRLLVENIGEMVEDEDWLFGQIAILQDIIDKPMDSRAIADAERSLRNAVIKQGMLKQSLNDAKSTLKNLMTSFIDRRKLRKAQASTTRK
jgi:diguanylate cyclase